MEALLILFLLLLALGLLLVRRPHGGRRRLRHDGLDRTYLLHVPATLPAGRVPLVLVLHGGGGNPEQMRRRTGWDRLADRNGFIVAYPAGTGPRRRLNWNAGGIRPQGHAEVRGVDDAGFIDSLLDSLVATYPVDPHRIFVTGMSKGGMLAYHLACRLAGRIAAIAPVAATMTAAPCPEAPPVSLLHIHGERDRNVPWQGGKGRYTARRADYAPVPAAIEHWRQRAGCSADSRVTHPASDTVCREFIACRPGTRIAYCRVDGGGHAWPGSRPNRRQLRRGEYVSPRFDASAYIWRFFEETARRSVQAHPAK